jgi:hypothetical protein
MNQKPRERQEREAGVLLVGKEQGCDIAAGMLEAYLLLV